uniref:Uncharacterized protein n=1 Tax=Anopheles farauti TaxID=69004 RepID=A0A182QTU0_9DIPT
MDSWAVSNRSVNSEQNTTTAAMTPTNSSMDIQLLNDDHEKAILSDLYKTGGTESTPLTTFSYISEYICSNNIEIWPGEIATPMGTTPGTVPGEQVAIAGVWVHSSTGISAM